MQQQHKSKNIFILFAFLLAASLLVSCKSSGGGNVAPQFNPRSGTEGIVLDFIEDAPPQELYEDSSVPLALKLENKGAADVQQGYLVWNVPSYLFTLEEHSETFELSGKKVDQPQGETKTFYRYAKAKALSPMQEVRTATIGATLCYDYETIFSEEICIDPQFYQSDKKKKPCEVKDITSSGQGGPVVITKVDVAMIPLDEQRLGPRFTVHLRNQGKGTVINKDDVQKACSSETSPNLFNIVYIEEAKLSKIYNLECTGLQRNEQLGRSYILLEEGKESSFICELKSGIPKDQGVFSTPLLIKLGYGYTLTKSKEITIRSRKV